MQSFNTSKFYWAKLASTRKADMLPFQLASPCSEHHSTLLPRITLIPFNIIYTSKFLGMLKFSNDKRGIL